MTIKRIYEAEGATHARRAAFWLLQPQSDDLDVPKEAEVNDGDGTKASDRGIISLSKMVEENKLSSTAAKEVFAELMKTGSEDAEKIAAEKNLLQVSDEGEIAKIVSDVLTENAKAAEDVKSGEMKAIGFLVGQVMKLSKGKANPQMAQDLIKKQLGL